MQLKNLKCPNFCDSMLNEGKIINFQDPCENNLSNSSMLKLNAKGGIKCIQNPKAYSKYNNQPVNL